MSKYPMVACHSCGKEFESQVRIDPAIYALAPNISVGSNSFACPHCNSVQTYSERDFRYTKELTKELASFGKIVKAFVDELQFKEEPLKAVSELLHELEEARNQGNTLDIEKSQKFYFLKKWIPNTPEKVAAYFVIAQIIFQLLTKEPDKQLDQTTIINRVDQTIIIQMQNSEDNFTTPENDKHIGRNEPCPCGSGSKYKCCHGKLI